MSEEFFKCSCQVCGGHIEVPLSAADMAIECPHCQQVTRLLRPGGPLKIGLAAAPRESEPPEPPKATPGVAGMARRRQPPAKKPGGKDWLTTFLLATFLGGLGVDRFYTGKIWLGVGKLLTCGGCGIWGLIDTILLLTEHYRDANDNCLRPAKSNHKKIAIVIFVITLLLGIVLNMWNLSEAMSGLDQ